MKEKIKVNKKIFICMVLVLMVIVSLGAFLKQKHRKEVLQQKATEKQTLLDSFRYGENLDTETKRSVFSNRNIMIFVPHEDDDLNLMCGLLEQYIQYGSQIRVVFSTNGDKKDLANERLHEAVNVLTSYGIPTENIIFLGYGDQWYTEYGHIYHAPDDVVVASANLKEATYGAGEIQPYKQESYTRNHLLTDIKELITDYKPDLLFCNDYDDHSDHKALSLFFEEALGQVLKDNPTYQPEVFKGFCYFDEWHGPADFYADNILSSHYDGTYMEDNPTYLWRNRVRFPVSQESVTRNIEDSRTYQALEGYVSQNCVSKAESIINGDKLFWTRRTDNEVLQADITVSSGKGDTLNDFKILDSSDVLNDRQFDAGIWIPDQEDVEKKITVTFKNPVNLSQIVLYDNPSLTDNILDATIQFCDGTTLTSGALDQSGAASTISFEEKQGITEMQISITQKEGNNAGLNEIEAFQNEQAEQMQIVKLEDMNENFAYDYQTDEQGMATFQIYEYPEVKGKYEVYLEQIDGGVVQIKDKAIGVYCPPGTHGTLILYDSEKETVVDGIWISNPYTQE